MASTPVLLIDPALGCSMIEAADAPAFGALLLQAAQGVGAVDEVFAFRLVDGAQPETMALCSEVAEADARVRLYTRRFHRFDPASCARQAVPAGSGFARTVRAGEIEQLDYRNLCFERPRFASKLCFGWRQPGQWLAVNFYRQRADDRCETSPLGALANIALTAMARRAGPSGSLVVRLERKLMRVFPQLTRREREVCARTLAGATSQSIAAELGIAAATVLTYRQRAYERLEISQASALLDRLVD